MRGTYWAVLLFGLTACVALAETSSSKKEEPIELTELTEVSEQEASKVVSFLASQGLRAEDGWTRIFKDDLDADGIEEYIATAARSLTSDSGHGRVIAVIQSLDSNPKLITEAPSNTDPGLAYRREFLTVDFDHDGTKDIVETRQYHSEAGSYCLIMKYDGRSLRQVYGAWSDDRCSLVDVDGDSIAELIEITNEFQLPIVALWPAIYRWREGAWQRADEAYPDFYREQAPAYEEVLSELRRKEAAYNEKAVELDELEREIIKAMETYLERIERISGKQ